MQIGNKVRWENAYRGRTMTTEGVIIGIVQAGDRPDSDLFPEFWEGDATPGVDRDEESYVVQTDDRTEQSGRRLFWPATGLLTVISEC